MIELIKSLGLKCLGFLPSFVCKKLYPLEYFKKHIVLDIQSRHDPVTVDCSGSPRVDIWFRIDNFTPFELTLKKLKIRFYLGQELGTQQEIQEFKVLKNSSERIRVEGNFDREHVSIIKANYNKTKFRIVVEYVKFSSVLFPIEFEPIILDEIKPRYQGVVFTEADRSNSNLL